MKMIFCTYKDSILSLDNQLPGKFFNISDIDFKYFKVHTIGKDIVMGRKTWESMGCKPLKDRGNHFIITSNPAKWYLMYPHHENVHYTSLAHFLKMYKPENTVCIGGAEIYDLLFDYCDEIIRCDISNVNVGNDVKYTTLLPNRILNGMNEDKFDIHKIYSELKDDVYYTVTNCRRKNNITNNDTSIVFHDNEKIVSIKLTKNCVKKLRAIDKVYTDLDNVFCANGIFLASSDNAFTLDISKNCNNYIVIQRKEENYSYGIMDFEGHKFSLNEKDIFELRYMPYGRFVLATNLLNEEVANNLEDDCYIVLNTNKETFDYENY